MIAFDLKHWTQVITVPYLNPGTIVADRTGAIYTRHLSELLHTMAGATVHYSRSTCPTWTDQAECRCMVK